jgi:hypothetical protein
MADEKPTQQTQPKKGEPITIPVPKRGDVMAFLEKTAKLPDPDRSAASAAGERRHESFEIPEDNREQPLHG